MSQPVAVPGDASSGMMGSIRSMARRLSGTFITAKVPASLKQGGRAPIYTWDEPDNGGQLKVGGVTAQDLVTEHGTPLFVYDANRIGENYHLYLNALQKSIPNGNFILAYAVKANPSLGLLDVLGRLGAGFEIVSGGELARVLNIGVDAASKVIFSGPGKTRQEVEAALEAGICCFNIESWPELELLEESARKLNKVASVSIRINPDLRLHDVDPGVTNVDQRAKFGVALSEVIEMSCRAKASAFLKVTGLAVHLVVPGSSLEPWLEARDKLLAIADTLRAESRIWIEHVNLGGGFPVGLTANEINVWIDKLTKPVSERGLRVILEPGKALVSDAALLLARVQQVKKVQISTPGSGTNSPRRGSLVAGQTSPLSVSPQNSINSGSFAAHDKSLNVRTFAILDAGITDVRLPASQTPRVVPGQITPRLLPQDFRYDIVGPLADLGDLLARDCILNEELRSGSLVAVADVGAYAAALAASAYCSRNRPAEVLVQGKNVHLIRERDETSDQLRREKTAPASLKLSTGLPDSTLAEGGEDNVSEAATDE